MEIPILSHGESPIQVNPLWNPTKSAKSLWEKHHEIRSPCPVPVLFQMDLPLWSPRDQEVALDRLIGRQLVIGTCIIHSTSIWFEARLCMCTYMHIYIYACIIMYILYIQIYIYYTLLLYNYICIYIDYDTLIEHHKSILQLIGMAKNCRLNLI